MLFRSLFLRQVALRTLGGLVITAIAALVSTFAIAPAVFQTNKWVVIAVVYGCVFGAQMLGRRMVYGDAKAAGIVVGAGLQGVALGFLLLVALATGSNGEGVSLIGYSLLMVVLSVAAMLLYVTAEKREFSMLRAGLTMMGIPLLIMMGLQVIFPFDGMAGVAISGVFLAGDWVGDEGMLSDASAASAETAAAAALAWIDGKRPRGSRRLVHA